MRTLVISNASRALLSHHIVGRAVAVRRQLADKSWEVEVDDDMAFALDRLSFDPDVAFSMLCTERVNVDMSPKRGVIMVAYRYCPRCECIQPTIDDGETCAQCKLVLP